MDEPVATDTMIGEVQPPAGPNTPSPKPDSPPQEATASAIRPAKVADEGKSPRHSQRPNQRRPPNKKKHIQDADQSWRWTGSPIVASGPLSSLWNSRQRPDDREKLSKTNVYLRGLPATITESELVAMCTPYGRVISAKALVDKSYNRGYGFVDFEQSSSADTAVRELRAQGLFARMAKAVPRNSEGRGDDPTNLYLANLPPDFSENHVECLLSQYGRITSARVLRDDAGRSRGVGFARMESLASCERAISTLNGLCNLIPGRPLLVKFADSKRADSKVRVRPAASPQMLWWPNSVGYQQLAVQTPPEHLQPLQLSPMQAPLQQHMQHLAQAPIAQAPMTSPAVHPGALNQPPMGSHAVYMNYGYRYVSMSAPPLSSPTMLPLGGSMGECWSPGEVEGAALVDGLN